MRALAMMIIGATALLTVPALAQSQGNRDQLGNIVRNLDNALNGGRQPQNESAPYGAPNGYSGPNNGYSGTSNPYAYGGPSRNGMVFHSQAQVQDEQRRLNNIQAQLNRAQQELNSEWQQFNQARAQYEGQ